MQLSVTPWTAAYQASLSFTVSWSLLELLFIELVMPSNHLILCCPLLLLPSIFPSFRVFSNESGLEWVLVVSCFYRLVLLTRIGISREKEAVLLFRDYLIAELWPRSGLLSFGWNQVCSRWYGRRLACCLFGTDASILSRVASDGHMISLGSP